MELGYWLMIWLQISIDEADPYYWIGKTYEAMGKKEDARNNYQSALNLDKDMAEAREGCSNISRVFY